MFIRDTDFFFILCCTTSKRSQGPVTSISCAIKFKKKHELIDSYDCGESNKKSV